MVFATNGIDWNSNDLQYFCDNLHVLPQSEILQFALQNGINLNMFYNNVDIKNDDMLYNKILERLEGQNIYYYNLMALLLNKSNNMLERWVVITNNKKEDLFIKNDALYIYISIFFSANIVYGILNNNTLTYKYTKSRDRMWNEIPFPESNIWRIAAFPTCRSNDNNYPEFPKIITIDNVLNIIYTHLLSPLLFGMFVSPQWINFLFTNYIDNIDKSIINYYLMDKKCAMQVFTIHDKNDIIVNHINSLEALTNLQ